MGELSQVGGMFAAWAGLIAGLLVTSVPVSAAQFAGGTGRPDDPYQIATAEQLIAIGQDPNLLDQHFVLTKDLDLDPNAPGGRVFEKAVIAPSLKSGDGFRGPAFSGTFDGKGHRIGSLIIDGCRASYLGLFGKTGKTAEIHDLTLENVCVSSSGACVAGLVGHNRGTITNCHVTGGLSGGTGEWCSCFGLVAGQNDGQISRCDVNARLTGALTTHGLYLGLLAGRSWGSIQNCTVRGTIMGGEQFRSIGGLTGENTGSMADSRASATISMSGHGGSNGPFGGLVGRNEGSLCRCFATGTVSCGMYARGAGGLVGDNNGIIFSCFAIGDVSANPASDVGGLVGMNSGRVVCCYATGKIVGNFLVGGLVGANPGTISQSYSAGPVLGGKANWIPSGGLVGGLVGSTDRGPAPGGVTCSFWDTQASGVSTSEGGTGLTSAQMKNRQTFLSAGWDLASERANGTADLWVMPERAGPPLPGVFLKGYQRHKLPGAGTTDDPYRIATAEDLGAICLHDTGACFKLVADVNLAGITWAVPVIPSFEGRFDGNGFTISSLTLQGDCFLGLFGVLGRNAVVQKLQVDKARIAAGNSASGLGLLAVENWGRIEDCRVVGVVAGGSKEEKYQSILHSNYGSIVNCDPIGDTGPWTTIVTERNEVRRYLKPDDEIWILESKDLDGLDEALRTYLESDTSIQAKTWMDREYVLAHFRQYNRAYAGFVRRGTKYVLCQMHLYDDRFGPQVQKGFASINDGGCSVVTVVFDAQTKAIVSIDCNGEL